MVIKYPDCCDRIPKGKIIIRRSCCVSSCESPKRCIETRADCRNYELCKQENRTKIDQKSDEFSPEINVVPNQGDLWEKQLDRWWGYNWMRRQNFKCCKQENKATNTCTSKKERVQEKTCRGCKTSKPKKKCHCTSSSEDSIVICKPTQHSCNKCNSNRNDTCCSTTPRCCCCCCPPPEPIIIKRRRCRRQYKAWIKEVSCCSDSDDNVCVYPKRKRSCTMKQNKDDLSKKIDNLKDSCDTNNSCYCAPSTCKNTSKLSNQKQQTSNYENNSKTPRKSKFIPDNKVDSYFFVTGSNLINAPKKGMNFPNALLKSIDIKDPNFISKPQFDWSENYNKIKEEHVQLLQNVCDVITSSRNSSEKDNEMKKLDNEVKSIPRCSDINTLEHLHNLWIKLPKSEKNTSLKDFSSLSLDSHEKS